MTSACKLITAILVILSASQISTAAEKKTDRWFGKDKFQHFGYSAFLSGGSYTVAYRHFERRSEDSFVISIGLTFSLGAAKEYIDYREPGRTSSYKDLAWDIAGALTGAIVASLTQ